MNYFLHRLSILLLIYSTYDFHNSNTEILGSRRLASKQDTTGTLAVTAQAPGQAWGRWSEQNTHQPIQTFYTMDVSGIVQSYNSRAASSAALTRTIMAPQYSPAQTYSGATNNMAATHQQQQQHQQHNPFSFGGYSGPNTNMIIPAFAKCNFVQQRPLPRLMQVDDDGSGQFSYPRPSRRGYIEEHHSQRPQIKTESKWPAPATTPVFHSTEVKTTPISTLAQEVNFGTEVDTLMKAIQAKEQTTSPQTTSSVKQIRPVISAFQSPYLTQATSQIAWYASREDSKYKLTNAAVQEDSSSPKNSKKRYQCTIANCSKIFYQQTHLDIHERAHTGVKPYVSQPKQI